MRPSANGQPQTLPAGYAVQIVHDVQALAALTPELEELRGQQYRSQPLLRAVDADPGAEPSRFRRRNDRHRSSRAGWHNRPVPLAPEVARSRATGAYAAVAGATIIASCVPPSYRVCMAARRSKRLLPGSSPDEAPASIVELELVAGDGPLWRLLADELRARPKWKSSSSVIRVTCHVCAGRRGANRDFRKDIGRSCDDWSDASARGARATSR